MRRRFVAYGLAVLALLPLDVAATAKPSPIKLSAPTGPRTAERFGLFETTAHISPEPVNPFDPAETDVTGHFRDPSGRVHRVSGFFFQDYSRALVDGRERLTPVDDPVWKVRFAPTQTGRWRWWWTVRAKGAEVSSRQRTLTVTTSDNHGYLRRSSHDSRYLAFDDGSPYFAVGENVGWYDERGTFAYDDWYEKLAAQGATYARLWMPSWAFGIEWKDTGLGDYTARLDRAWQLDHVLDAGARRGIYQMISLLNHGAFSTTANSEWRDNPYNAANDGPLRTPDEFFTDTEAIELFQQRLRYIVARWGYSTHVLAWELWNEVDLTDGYDPIRSALWHQAMAGYLREIDPTDHLVTTSFSLPPLDPAVWSFSGMDLHQTHFYSRSDVFPDGIFPNIALDMSTWLPANQAVYQRPALWAEFGIDARGPGETHAADPQGIGLHDGVWAGALSGAFGTGMTWWWDNYVDPNDFYPVFGSVARFIEGVRWDREGFVRATGTARSASRRLVLYGLQGSERAVLWVKNDQHQWNHPDPVVVQDGSLLLTGLAPGAWCGSWWDTRAGTPRQSERIEAGATLALVSVPAFIGDIALRIERC